MTDAEKAKLQFTLEVIKQDVDAAFSGKVHDGSWIRPMRISSQDRIERAKSAISRLDELIAECD